MSVKDKASNTTESAKGTLKKVAGQFKGDRSLEAEGMSEQAKGNLKQAGEKIKDAVKE